MGRNTRFTELDERDLAVVKDVVRFGWMATDQIARRYHLPPTSNPAQLKRLVSHQLLQRHDKTELPGGGKVYTATRLGGHFAGVGLRSVTIRKQYLEHHLAVIDVADALLADDPGADWLTEREYVSLRTRRAKQYRWSGHGHVPDGILVSSDKRWIAIEVELTEKDWVRYVDICRWYAEHFEIDALRWYVDVPGLKKRLPLIMRQHGLDADLGMTVHDLPPGVEVRR